MTSTSILSISFRLIIYRQVPKIRYMMTCRKKIRFQGGLVPGVEVYAYMIYPMLQHFGEEWLTVVMQNVDY